MGILSRFRGLLGGEPTEQPEGEQYNDPSFYAVRTPKKVTEDTSLQVSTVWACVKLIAGTVSSLPMEIIDKENDGERATDHPLYPLLNYSPNAYMTCAEFTETMMLNYGLRGNGYAEKQRNARGQVIALWPLPADNVTPIRDGMNLFYEYEDRSSSTARKIRYEDMLVIKEMGNGLVGLDKIAYARNAIGLALASEGYGVDFYLNGGKADNILKIDTFLKKEQRAQVLEMLEMWSSQENQHKTRLLEGGMSLEQQQMNPEQMQMNDTRAAQVEDIARYYGVPSILINDNKDTTAWGSGIEQIILGWLNTSLGPQLNKIEQAYEKSLLSISDRRRYEIRYNINSLVRADARGTAEAQVRYVQGGIKTQNEARRAIGLPPVDDDSADQLYMQQQMTPSEDLGNENVV